MTRLPDFSVERDDSTEGLLPRRLLLVEDSASDQRLLIELLLDAGADPRRVSRASTLAQARALLEVSEPDCVLLDLTLPDAFGLEGVSVIAAAVPQVPIVVITGRRADSLVYAAMAKGADEYLFKTDLDANQLRDVLVRAFQRRRGTDRATRPALDAEAVLDSIEAPTAALAASGRIIAVNRAWTIAAAASADDSGAGVHPSVGADYLRVCKLATGSFGEGAAQAAAGIGAVLDGRTERFVIDYPCNKGGAEAWFSLRASPLGKRGGGAVVTHLDITELKTAELRLQRDAARLACLYGETARIFALVGRDGTIEHLSETAETLLGMHEDQTVAAWVTTTVAATDRDRAAEAFARVLSGPGASERLVLRLVDRTGRSRQVEVSLANLTEDPAATAVAVTASDMSAGRLQEIARRLESRLLQRLPAAVVVTDDDGFVVYWNDQAVALFGFSADFAVGRSVVELNTGPSGEQRARSVMESVLATGHWEGDSEARRADGSVVPVHAVLERVEEPDIGFSGVVGASIDISDRRQLEESLAFQALHDPMTGLANRRLFVEHLEQALARSARTGRNVGVISIDIDDFKSVNDRFGGEKSDEVLRAVAALLGGTLRPGDVLSRLGGDEFAACFPLLEDAAEAYALAETVLRATSAPFCVAGETFALTTSVGLAVSTPRSRAEALIRDADSALYAAKVEGKARVHMFDQALHEVLHHRHELAKDLRRSLDAGEIVAFYQPEVDLLSGELVGFEALARWRHAERGWVAPDEFIPVAETSGLISQLTKQMLRDTCCELAAWLDASPGRALEVAVNVSPGQLLDPELPGIVGSTIAEHGIPADRLCLEVTESALVDGDAAAAVLHQLKAIGVEIAIDDFGTGYSSLSRLRQFPIDYLKVDRSFVSGMAQRAADAAIVSAVIGLAHSLGLRTIAEGIEGRTELDQLGVWGCERGQGYLWSKPVPADQARLLVLSSESFEHAQLPARRRLAVSGSQTAPSR